MSLEYSEHMEVGAKLPTFNLKNAQDDEPYYLSNIDKKGAMIVFTCNHCPYAKASWPVILDLYDDFADDIEFIAINSNDASSHPEDSYQGMKTEIESREIEFAYLHDDTQDIAKTFNAVCTPDPFLFKKNGKRYELFYHGRLNDNWKEPEMVEEESMKLAIDTMLAAGDPIEDPKPSMGCSIKWK